MNFFLVKIDIFNMCIVYHYFPTVNIQTAWEGMS